MCDSVVLLHRETQYLLTISVSANCVLCCSCITGPKGTAPACVCVAGYEGNGTYCNGEHTHTHTHPSVTPVRIRSSSLSLSVFSELDLCSRSNGGCSEHAICTKVSAGERTCTCKDGYTGDGVICLGMWPYCLTSDHCNLKPASLQEPRKSKKTGILEFTFANLTWWIHIVKASQASLALWVMVGLAQREDLQTLLISISKKMLWLKICVMYVVLYKSHLRHL